METNKNDQKSMFMIVTAMLIFGTIGIFRRYLPFSSGFLAFSRGILGGVSLLAFMKVKGMKGLRNIGQRNLVIFIICGMLIGVNWILLFESYNYTTVPVATLCYYMEPTIVVLASPIIFKERLTLKKLICAIVAIVGMMLISGIVEGGKIGTTDTKGILFGLSAAVIYAIVVMINKKTHNDDAYSQTTIQLFAASSIMIPYLLLTRNIGANNVTPITIIMILIVGFIHTGFAYVLYFGSMKGLKAQSIALTSYIDPVSALFFSFLFLHESLSAIGLLGAIMIIGAAILSEIELKL